MLLPFLFTCWGYSGQLVRYSVGLSAGRFDVTTTDFIMDTRETGTSTNVDSAILFLVHDNKTRPSSYRKSL
jgi:hypothetical protein